MRVSDLVTELQKMDQTLPVVARLPELVFVDNRIKPGIWHHIRSEFCSFLAVKI